MKKLFFTAVLSICSLIGAMSLTASAQGEVVINGVLFQGQELSNLEQNLGYEVPPGRYWLNTNTGDWGYEGNPYTQGNIYQQSGWHSPRPVNPNSEPNPVIQAPTGEMCVIGTDWCN